SATQHHCSVVPRRTVSNTVNYTATLIVAYDDAATVRICTLSLHDALPILSNTTPANSTVNAIEGNAFSNLVLMTFDDNNPSASSDDFSATPVTYSRSTTFTSVPSYSMQANGSASCGQSHLKVVVSGTAPPT